LDESGSDPTAPRRFQSGIGTFISSQFRSIAAFSHYAGASRGGLATAVPKFLVPRGKWQQGDVPGLLDGAGQAALVRGANAGEPPRHNLAALGHKPLQQPHVAVWNRVDLLGAELADLLATEEFAASAGSTGWTAARAARPAALAGA
jgi:hypothetical protein